MLCFLVGDPSLSNTRQISCAHLDAKTSSNKEALTSRKSHIIPYFHAVLLLQLILHRCYRYLQNVICR